jgi:hypothetical protein
MKGIDKKRLLMVLALASMTIFQSCENSETEGPVISQQEEIEIVESSTDRENILDEDLLVVERILAAPHSFGGRLSTVESCAVVTRNKEEKMITIDFGNGCTDRFGRERSGKIIITFRGEFARHADRIISFEDYFINNRKITGTIQLLNFHRNDEDNLTSTRKLVDYAINYPDGNTFVKNGSVTREWIEGEGDTIAYNNIYKITGSYHGVSSRGREIKYTITEPIIADFNCHAAGGFLRTAGVTEVIIKNSENRKIRTVAYGDGTCDNEYTITVNGRSRTITRS